MSSRHLFASLFVATALLTTACASETHVVRSAYPNPYSCQSAFVVQPIEYADLRVGEKSEAQYLSTKDHDQRANWEGNKVAIEREFRRSLLSQTAEEGIHVDLAPMHDGTPRYVVRPVIHFVEPGFFGGPAMGSSEIRMTVLITTPDGQVLDELELNNETMGSLVHVSARSRFERDGELLGELTAEYIEKRVAAGSPTRQSEDELACAPAMQARK
jgi:hypothetical protein